jgi:hypothetical protein
MTRGPPRSGTSPQPDSMLPPAPCDLRHTNKQGYRFPAIGAPVLLCCGGWVVGMGGCIVGCAHHLAHSSLDFRKASIHCLPSW